MINGNISEVTSPATLFAEQRIPYRSCAAVYPWNAAFNREYPAVLLTPLWLTKPHFTPLYCLKWPFLGTKPSDQVAEKKCQHRLDWFHFAQRLARIEKEFLYAPMGMISRNVSRLTGQT